MGEHGPQNFGTPLKTQVPKRSALTTKGKPLKNKAHLLGPSPTKGPSDPHPGKSKKSLVKKSKDDALELLPSHRKNGTRAELKEPSKSINSKVYHPTSS